jgi:hypothetical protein
MLFQKDYWIMDERDLAKLTRKCKIPSIGRAGEGGRDWYFPREDIINQLDWLSFPVDQSEELRRDL